MIQFPLENEIFLWLELKTLQISFQCLKHHYHLKHEIILMDIIIKNIK